MGTGKYKKKYRRLYKIVPFFKNYFGSKKSIFEQFVAELSEKKNLISSEITAANCHVIP